VAQGVATNFFHHIPVPLQHCRSFFLFQFIAIGVVSIATDMIFMIRVYALYYRQRWVGVVMVTLLTLETTAIAVIIPRTMSLVNFNFLCGFTIPMRMNVAFSTVCAVPPVIAFCFIGAKQIIALRDGWGKAPLMVLLTRDGSLGVLGLLGVWLVNPLISSVIGGSLVHLSHQWFMSVIPSIGCRVILNMQHFKMPTQSTNTSDHIQLTTPVAGFPLPASEYHMEPLKSQGLNLRDQHGLGVQQV